MSDVEIEDLRSRLVVERKRDGRCVYDHDAKAQLLAMCQRPGASVSGLARQCGINTNQVSRWLREQRGSALQLAVGATRSGPVGGAPSMTLPAPAFVEVPAPSRAAEPDTPATLELQARLPNGVVLDVRGLGSEALVRLIDSLSKVLACSASPRT